MGKFGGCDHDYEGNWCKVCGSRNPYTISGYPLGSEADNEYHRATGEQVPKLTAKAEARDVVAVAWKHNLTGVVRWDKPAAGMGLHEDYTPLYASPPSVPTTIDDAMVERAAEVLRLWGMEHGNWTAARAALEASLGRKS